MFNRAYEAKLLEPFRIHSLSLLLCISAELPGQRHTGPEYFVSMTPNMDSSQWEGIIHIPFADFLRKGFAK